MKTLFAVWSLAALALAGTIQFAHSPEQGFANGRSLTKAGALVGAFGTRQKTELPLATNFMVAKAKDPAIAAPANLQTHIDTPAVHKAKPKKVTQKKSKKNRAEARKRKTENPVLASFRKVDRFLKRAF